MRTFHLLRALAERHDVTVVAFDTAGRPAPAPFAIRVVEVPWETPPLYVQMHGNDPRASTAAFEALAGEDAEPWIVSCNPMQPMIDALRRLVDEPWDLVLVEHSTMARYLCALPAHLPRVLDLHNVHALMAAREANSAGAAEREALEAEAKRVLRYERDACTGCDIVLTCSTAEADAVRSMFGVTNLAVIPNGADTAKLTPSSEPAVTGRLLFTGTMDYPPNSQGVRWFGSEVLPLIRRVNPAVHLHIVGARPPDEVTALACAHIVVHGQVPEMVPHFASAQVVVVPLLHGGGTRLKIVDAAACGKPIVSTTLGAEGLEFVAGRDLLVADSAEAFASSVLELLASEDSREALGRAARRAAEAYDWERITGRFIHVIEDLPTRSPARLMTA